MPSMSHSLDEVLALPEDVKDLQVVTRDFVDGSGTFEAVHNAQLSNSLLSGKFECTTTKGVTRYEGTFLNDPHNQTPTPSGQGMRQNPDGSTYAGEWKNGHPHGHGEWKAAAPSCESYVGEWKNGRKHGFGVQKFANGDMYEGDFANGKFQDRGKYCYANGDEFMGLWDNGVKVSGTFYYRDGRTSTRRYDKGVLASCQDFDAQRQVYHPTLSKARVHDTERRGLGLAGSFVVTPRGVRVD